MRTGTVADDVAAQVIENQLLTSVALTEAGLYRQFASLCMQTEDCAGLPFVPMALRQADVVTRKAAYDAYTHLSIALRDKWVTARNLVNADSSILIADYEDGADPK